MLNYQQIVGKNSDWGQQLDPLKVLPQDSGNPGYAMDMESGFGVPKGHKNTALEGSSANLTQGDLLQALGSQLSARSDTFVIRAYGESTDPISGEVVASARCEAVVQRIAEPVETNDSILDTVWNCSASNRRSSGMQWMIGICFTKRWAPLKTVSQNKCLEHFV